MSNSFCVIQFLVGLPRLGKPPEYEVAVAKARLQYYILSVAVAISAATSRIADNQLPSSPACSPTHAAGVSQLWLTRCAVRHSWEGRFSAGALLHSADTELDGEDFLGKDAIGKRLRIIFQSDFAARAEKQKKNESEREGDICSQRMRNELMNTHLSCFCRRCTARPILSLLS